MENGVFMSDLILLRHGETAGQSSTRFYGSTDIGLSELGREQMRRAGEVLRELSFRTVITSPLRRSYESASIVSNGLTPEPVVIKDFREINFGEWEGLTAAEIEECDPDGYRTWKEFGTLSQFPGGDSKEAFYQRVSAAAKYVFTHVERPVLAVLHKGVIRGILAALLNSSPVKFTHHPIELGSIHRLSRTPVCWKLLSTNEIGHLGECRIKHS